MFEFDHIADGHIPAWEYYPTNAATYLVGDAMYFAASILTAVSTGAGQDTAGGTHYICMANATVATDGDQIPVVKCTPDIIWRTKLGVASPTIALDAAYTIHTDGRSITATVTAGAFKVERYDGKLAGDYVYGTLV